MTATIRKYTKYNLVCLKILGLWTEEDSILGTKYYWIYSIFVNVFCSVLCTLTQLLNLVQMNIDVEELSTSAHIVLTCAVTNLKTYCFYRHFSLLKDTLSSLDQEDFQPRNKRQGRKVHDFMGIYVMFQKLLFGCCILAMPIWILSPLVLSKEINLPFKAWYPFVGESSSILFTLSFIHQSFGVFYIAFANTAVDLVTVGLISFVAVECDLLVDILENMHEFAKERLEVKGITAVQASNVSEEMNRTLLDCVRLHWKILKFARDTNRIFNIYIFVMFANSLFAICMSMIRMVVVGIQSAEIFIVAVQQVFISSELLMYCWFGNELIAKSDNIAWALYNSDWVDCPRAFKKNMAFFMLRTSQRPIRMFGVNFFALSLATFTYILKASWSFFTMLNQLRTESL